MFSKHEVSDPLRFFMVARNQETLGLSITFRVSRYQSNEILGLHTPRRSVRKRAECLVLARSAKAKHEGSDALGLWGCTRPREAFASEWSVYLWREAPKLNTKGATHSDFKVAHNQRKLGLSITFRVSRYQSNEILGLHTPRRSRA